MEDSSSSEKRSSARAGVPALLWLWAAPAIVVLQIAFKAVSEESYRRWMRTEFGLVENLTVAFLVGAIVCAIGAWRRRQAVRWRFFGPAMIVILLGLVFFAGEELSWGQHWLGFTPPESIAARNDQGEFNFHNDPVLGSLLDQLPRNLLTLAALAAAIVPFVLRSRAGRRDFDSPGPWGWVWPGFECFPSAFVAVTVSLPEKLFESLDRPVPYLLEISPGETKEYCLALFLFVYLLALVRALKAHAAATR